MFIADVHCTCQISSPYDTIMAKMIPSIALAVFVFLLPAGGFAGQRGAAPAPAAPSGNKGGNQPTTSPSNAPATNQPTTNNPPTPPPAPIFISGNVMMSDGTPAPPTVRVRIECGTSAIRTD